VLLSTRAAVQTDRWRIVQHLLLHRRTFVIVRLVLITCCGPEAATAVSHQVEQNAVTAVNTQPLLLSLMKNNHSDLMPITD
jgi:hypothetical protein